MTSLQIELPSDLYARLQSEAQRQGKAERKVVEEWLVAHLTRSTTEPVVSTSISIHLAPEVADLLKNMTDADMIVPPKGTPEDAIRLLEAWNEEDTARADDEDDDGDGTWDDVLRAIDANRHSSRKLFPELEQPQ
ncbi:hypothetical protein [Candidatus Viridilinea mediisalina]|uniref:Uncharacterized protein n=1 Tax=Candidatus Viridilinea mediisalina TaxID=2024553 RepID=A0A2A6RGN3_9CHLR|nr:hypothetical protein [Candidatus Viridilinea mediisalina]PDW02049.1 hypothetical protein CJ255_16070 [Candidatus Viridilinea mediisalina]